MTTEQQNKTSWSNQGSMLINTDGSYSAYFYRTRTCRLSMDINNNSTWFGIQQRSSSTGICFFARMRRVVNLGGGHIQSHLSAKERFSYQGSSLLILSYSLTASVNASTSCSSRVTPRAYTRLLTHSISILMNLMLVFIGEQWLKLVSIMFTHVQTTFFHTNQPLLRAHSLIASVVIFK